MTSLLNRILARASGESKSLYDLHPELTERVPILRQYSDEVGSSLIGYSADAAFYTTSSWVYKAISVVGNNFASLPVVVAKGEGSDLELLPNHDISKLLDAPNDSQGPAEFWREWVLNMNLGGESGLEAVRSRAGGFMEMYLRSPDQFTVKPKSTRYHQVLNYRVDDQNGAPYIVPPEEFCHFKYHNPLEPWRGLAPLTAVRMAIVIDQLAQAWTQLFFRNQARPDYAVITPEGLTFTERQEIEMMLMQKFGEPHKPLVLEKGITDIKTFSWAPKDVEWAVQRELSRDEIGAVFGVPDEIMGYGRDTYENFDTADRVLWTLTIVPLATLRDSALTRFLRRAKAIQPGERVISDLSGVEQLQEDKSAKIEQWDRLVARGVPANLASHYLGLGLPEFEGGDVGYLPMGLVPTTSTRRSGSRSAGNSRSKSLPDYGSAEHEALWRAKQAKLDNPVKALQRIVKREFQRQQNEIGRRLRDSRSFGRGQFKNPDRIPPVQELFDLEAEVQKFIEAIRDNVARVIAQLAQLELVDLGLTLVFDVTRPQVQGAIRQILEAVARKTNETTWTGLVELFQEAEAAGEGIPSMMERLSAFFGDRKSDYQTERIARTTMTGSANLAADEAWVQSGVVASRTWISALAPGRTRDAHAEAHGQTRQLNEAFEVGGELLMRPGDPAGSAGNIIHCLCVMVPNVISP